MCFCEAMNKQNILVRFPYMVNDRTLTEIGLKLAYVKEILFAPERAEMAFASDMIRFRAQVMSLGTISRLSSLPILLMLDLFSLTADDFPHASGEVGRKQLKSTTSLRLVIPRLRKSSAPSLSS